MPAVEVYPMWVGLLNALGAKTLILDLLAQEESLLLVSDSRIKKPRLQLIGFESRVGLRRMMLLEVDVTRRVHQLLEVYLARRTVGVASSLGNPLRYTGGHLDDGRKLVLRLPMTWQFFLLERWLYRGVRLAYCDQSDALTCGRQFQRVHRRGGSLLRHVGLQRLVCFQ